MSRIDFQLECVHCGASLSGLGVGDACAHCGLPVGDTISLAALDPVDMSVQIDLSCIGCGYNVRTLRFDAVCPECFKPVVESLRPDELRFADPTWLRTVRSGAILLLVAVVGISVLYLGLTLLGALFLGWQGSGSAVCAIVLVVILYAVGVAGVFAATTSNPHPRGRGGSNAPRNAARVLILLPIACVLVPICAGGPGSGAAVIAAFVVMALCIVGNLTSTLICLKRIAVGARRRGLGQLTAVLIWMIIAEGVAGGTAIVAQGIMMQRMFARIAAAPPGAAQSAAFQPATTAPVSSEADNVEPGDAGESAGAGTATGPSTAAVTAVTVGPGVAVTTTTTSTVAPGAAGSFPTPNPVWMMLIGVLTCGVGILLLGCCIVGLIVLVKYRNMLKDAIAASPVKARAVSANHLTPMTDRE